jgi:hypothetical protein
MHIFPITPAFIITDAGEVRRLRGNSIKISFLHELQAAVLFLHAVYKQDKVISRKTFQVSQELRL